MSESGTTSTSTTGPAQHVGALAIVNTTPARGGELLADTADRIVDGIARAGLDLLDAHGELVVLPIGEYGRCSFGLMDAVLTELESRIASSVGRRS